MTFCWHGNGLLLCEVLQREAVQCMSNDRWLARESSSVRAVKRKEATQTQRRNATAAQHKPLSSHRKQSTAIWKGLQEQPLHGKGATGTTIIREGCGTNRQGGCNRGVQRVNAYFNRQNKEIAAEYLYWHMSLKLLDCFKFINSFDAAWAHSLVGQHALKEKHCSYTQKSDRQRSLVVKGGWPCVRTETSTLPRLLLFIMQGFQSVLFPGPNVGQGLIEAIDPSDAFFFRVSRQPMPEKQ